MFNWITFDEHIMGGRTWIRGMRIPVSVIVGQAGHDSTFEEIADGYPNLKVEDIPQAVEYTGCLAQKEVHCRESSP